ncbi:IS3 family transposase [Sphingopyxis terrae subsp. terrae]|nr:IS3 family transposase [Sphingopyxis terrae subsp. terrae]
MMLEPCSIWEKWAQARRARRQLVDDIRSTWQVSIRRACSVLRSERSSYHYRGKGADQADLKQRIKELAETRVRYGYRRIHMLLQREGWAINGKQVYRLYKEMGLGLRNKPSKRRVKAKLREGRCAASRVNDVWVKGFVQDQLATGPKLRILTVVDTFRRFSPAVVPRFRFRAPDVVEMLERVCGQVGYPASIWADSGIEFISCELDLWACMKGVTLGFLRLGKPTDNAFNGKFRAECLNAHWFMSLDDAVQKCEAWRRDYNEIRPHSAIGNKPPISLMLASAAHGPP